HPETPLFQRSRDAIGFYAQLQDAGQSPWDVFPDMLAAAKNDDAFQIAIKSVKTTFLNQWASGFSREVSRGFAWDINGPGIRPFRATPTPLSVGNGGNTTLAAPVYTNQLAKLTVNADVITISSNVAVRISDANHSEQVGVTSDSFCFKQGGC